MQPHSIYIHIPFCTHRCAYCDFNTYANLEHLREKYVQALVHEIEQAANSAPSQIPIHTIFLGGGTPSLLESASIAAIIASIKENFALDFSPEITMEANPEKLTEDYLCEIRALGVNRLSIGMQSAIPEELNLLERGHDFMDVARVVRQARNAGFDNLNLDLIFALPGQSLADWQASLNLALGLEPEHISLYALSFEHGTPFSKMLNQGLLPLPSTDLAADMYLLAERELEIHGFEHYEISNWAKKQSNSAAYSCRHNLQYWRNAPYFGFGAGAHGWIDGCRTHNVLSPQAYIERLEKPPAHAFPRTAVSVEAKRIDRQTEIGETMMMGLRLLNEGISAAAFQKRFGLALQDAFGNQIESLLAKGLIQWAHAESDRVLLTPRGRLLGNQVFQEFV